MSGGIKTALILVLLGGVVFGVTIIASYSGGFQQASTGDDATTDGGSVGEPLLFGYREISYDPQSADEDWGGIKRSFPGFFENGPELYHQSFWFRQPHKSEVRIGVRGVSCTACTSARLGLLPPDPLADYVKQVKDGKLPLALGSPESLTAGLIAAGLSVSSQVRWKEFDFAHPEQMEAVPPGGGGKPTVGVVQMVYKATIIGPKTLDAFLTMSVGDAPPANMKLSVAFFGMPPFRIIPSDNKLAVGELPEGVPPRTVTTVVWSATRRLDGPGRTLPPPAVAVLPKDPFVSVGAAVPVPTSELAAIAASLEENKVTPPVLGAYRIPITVHRKKPADAPADTPPEPEIGPFERQVAYSLRGDPITQTITLSGVNSGLVALADVKLIDLESFPGRTGKPSRGYTLVADRPNLKLSVAEAECKPRFVAVKLGDPEDAGGKRRWRLTVGVPPDAGLGEFPADSAVVLLADTGDGPPRKVRLPLKGRAHSGR